jgi:polysaccharide biosynthesis protein PslG
MPKRQGLLAALIAFLIVAAACVPQTPIPVYVTPTALPTETPSVVATVALDPTTPAAVPSLDATQQFEESQTPRPTAVGPVIGPGYTVPPTTTPRLTPTSVGTEIPPTGTTIPIPVAPGGIDGNVFGVQLYYNMDVPSWEQVMGQAAQLRLGWVKLQANWSFLQPDRAGQFDQNFALFQQHVQRAEKQGFRVILSIAKAPGWARNVDRNYDGPPDDLSAFARFLNELLDYVGPHIDAIEIWNEPNLEREWTGALPHNGAAYMDLFRVGYDTIRARYPDMVIISAGLAPVGAVPGAVDDRQFLQQMYNAGLANYRDVKIGAHPFSWGNAPDATCCAQPPRGWDDDPRFFFADTLNAYASIIAQNGHSAPMWVTEFGWATWDGFPGEMPEPWMAFNNPQNQAEYTLRAMQIGQERADVEMMVLWNLNFGTAFAIEDRQEQAAYSLLYPDFAQPGGLLTRPLYWAIAQRP